MTSTRVGLWLLVITCGPGIGLVQAQRGVGDPLGIARQGVMPDIVTLAGTVTEVRIGPCENTTGPSLLGAHFLMQTPENDILNIHLGPVAQVEVLVKDLAAGQPIEVEGFRTEKMEAGHYVAQTLAYGDHAVTLRDKNLRPVWAGGRGAGTGGGGWGAGFGRGRGAGAGWGYQRGWGQGRGSGQQGRGRGPRW